jgi:hypothetical protein
MVINDLEAAAWMCRGGVLIGLAQAARDVSVSLGKLNQPRADKPELGKLRSLPVKKRQSEGAFGRLVNVPNLPTEGNPHFQSLFALLTELDVVERVFRPHYLRTVSELGNPELAKAQGLAGALKELSSLRGSELTKAVPRGLLQFLARLACEKDLRAPIGLWLETHAPAQKNTLAEIRSKLELEAQNKILFIVTEFNACQGEHRGLQGLSV